MVYSVRSQLHHSSLSMQGCFDTKGKTIYDQMEYVKLSYVKDIIQLNDLKLILNEEI